MKKFFQEFKEFISKGNIVDMAVGVVVGGAFREIVNALVNNIIMPLLEKATGGVSIEQWKWVLTPEIIDEVTQTVTQPEVAVQYGIFLQAIIDFLIIAFCIFVVLKVMMTAQKKMQELLHKKAEEEAAVVEESAETEMDVLKDIRELLVKQNEMK